MTSSTVKKLFGKLRETGSVGDTDCTGGPKTSRSNANIEGVRESVVGILEYQFRVVDKNCKFQGVLQSVYSLKILVSMFTKFSYHNN